MGVMGEFYICGRAIRVGGNDLRGLLFRGGRFICGGIVYLRVCFLLKCEEAGLWVLFALFFCYMVGGNLATVLFLGR